MEILGVVAIIICSWLAQILNDSEEKREKEVKKRMKEKIKNEQYVNIRVIKKL